MTRTGGLDVVWHTAIEHVLEDPEGEDIRRSQGLWALAVRAEVGADVRCGGDVFGPVLTPGGFVVMRPAVAVRAADPARVFEACVVAWRRFAQVDEFGVEASAEEHEEDPDPFGYPRVQDGWVWLSFDARQDEEPYPHRALTCLLILLQELRAAGCTPAQVVNLLHLPDDEGVDFADLGAQAAAPGDDRATPSTPRRPPVPGAGPRMPRPEWLPDFHEVARARSGRPTGPVPFILIAGGRIMAWEPTQGLLRLPPPEAETVTQAVFNLGSLTPDGAHLSYLRSPGPRTTNRSWSHGVLDICSGAASIDPATATEVFHGPTRDLRLLLTWPPRNTAPGDVPYRYQLLHGPGAIGRELPLQHWPMAAVGSPAAQFSASGRLLMTSHNGPDNRRYVVCSDIATGKAREYDGAHLLGTASFSPDETHVLIMRGNQPYVLDLDSGHSTFVHMYPIEDDEPTGPALWDALGFLDNHGLVVTKRYGRRIRLAYQPVDNSSRHMVLDIPVSATQDNTLGIALAPALLHTAPHLIGYQPQ